MAAISLPKLHLLFYNKQLQSIEKMLKLYFSSNKLRDHLFFVIMPHDLEFFSGAAIVPHPTNLEFLGGHLNSGSTF